MAGAAGVSGIGFWSIVFLPWRWAAVPGAALLPAGVLSRTITPIPRRNWRVRFRTCLRGPGRAARRPLLEPLIGRTVEEITTGAVYRLLPEATRRAVSALPRASVREAALRMLERPVPAGASPCGGLLMNPCLAVQWLAVFEQLELPRRLRVYEPCPGSSEPVVLALEIYSNGGGEYVGVNLNRPLAAQLRPKLQHVQSTVRLIEEDATRAAETLAPGGVDVACFHHAINDLLQTAVAEPRGMDTRAVDWWPNERQMIEWLAEEYAADGLAGRGRPALLAAVSRALDLTRPGGVLLFDHWTWQGHREQPWFPWELFCDLIPLARGWIGEARLPVEEVALPGKDPRWWMALRRLPAAPATVP
jgi:SAM-dependent methyltransferase